MAAKVGAFVDACLTAPKPGRKKDAGVTVCEALIPPQPIPVARTAPVIANRSIFQFNFTIPVWGGAIMGATTKSPFLVAVGATLALFLMALPVAAQTNFAAQAEAAFKAAKEARATNANDFKASLDLARAAFDWAEFAKSNDEREGIAEIGMNAARSAISQQINSAPAHYYMALNIGQLARTKMLGALKLLGQMEAELKKSIELDQKFDYAGATRTLGVLYFEAPGWPASIGDKSKARTLMERALELAPNYPDNHLTYMEALLKWKDWKKLDEKMLTYSALLPAAKKEFAAASWQDEWADWDKRWEAIQTKAKRR
jgi:tetratricopeptide (TPR) repeat protein